MAPIKIQHIVSFTSQDPKHPVDNLVSEDSIQPWLSCPRDRSRQLKVELQLERACHIGYIDIGNSGSAFLQIDVGRSSWPLNNPFETLLPTTTLMSPEDSKLGKNFRGVRMFKEGDFLEETASEKWDRLRVTCSQPFNKQEQFGLSFIRIRSPLEEENVVRTPTAGFHQGNITSQVNLKSRERSTREGEAEAWSQMEEKLKERLQHSVTPSAKPGSMSRTARMVLSAAKSRKRSHPTTAPLSPPIPLRSGESVSPVSSGSCPETSFTRHSPIQKEPVTSSGRRRLQMVVARGRGRAQTRNPERHLTQRGERDSPCKAQRSPGTGRNCSSCPICAGYFPADFLPTHASTCGVEPASHIISLSSDDDSDDFHLSPALPDVPVFWVPCPLCQFPFCSSEIEQHASTCRE
ncbi:protein XNDC1N isoform X2 [Mixophyes fleayi]|uniref:protein XNDC1N isoform X2 n=1 Tax=Mixophyes fleayi TaxID=3061075 RepID=UPI003F4DC7E8